MESGSRDGRGSTPPGMVRIVRLGACSRFASNAATIGSGVNWYWNQYVKLVFEYEHIIFSDPVAINATETQTSSDLFLLRTQVSF